MGIDYGTTLDLTSLMRLSVDSEKILMTDALSYNSWMYTMSWTDETAEITPVMWSSLHVSDTVS